MDNIKIFSLQEANRLLPELTRLLQSLQALRMEVLAKQVEIDALELVTDPEPSAMTMPPLLQDKLLEYDGMLERFRTGLEEIQDTGAVLKELESGLIDFYSVIDSQIGYLCWKMGEPEIRFWHEIGKGFSHRQTLPVNQQDPNNS